MTTPCPDSIVVVSGYKRSGTSLMMKLVQQLGVPAYFDDSFEHDKAKFQERVWYNGRGDGWSKY